MATWNPEADPNNRVIYPPHGLPLAVIIIVAFFAIVSTISIGIRVFVRTKDKVFGWDDGIMVAGGVCWNRWPGTRILQQLDTD